MSNDQGAMKELDYGITCAVGALITAMGMVAENQDRLRKGYSIAYGEEAFNELRDKNGLHHNSIITRWQGIY